MESMRDLQEANEQYKQEQERIQQEAKTEQERLRAEASAEQVLLQDQFMVEIEASRAANEELRKTNKDLCKNLQQHDRHSTRERGLNLPLRDCSNSFSQAIMDELVPPHNITPKIVFIGVEDPENHLTTFNAQMIVSGGTDVIQCKMFMSTFIGTTLQWFSGLPDGHITSFEQFSRLFRGQFFVNQVKPPMLYDLFNVRQREGESLKDYLNRLWALTVRL